MENNLNDLRLKLEQMSTTQLRDMVREEAAKETPDDDLVLLLLQILEERDADKPIELGEKGKAAWRKYQNKVKHRAGMPTRFRRMLAVAASMVMILGLLIAAVPQEAKAGSIFDVLARWTDSMLAFFNFNEEKLLLEYEFKTDNPGLQQLRDTVVEYGGTERAVPMWIPEGNELIALEIDIIPNKTTISAVFSNDDGAVVIKADIYDTTEPREFYKSLIDPQELEMYGNIHYTVQNHKRWSAAWVQDNTECFITLECQKDILHNILKSIYVMEAE